MIGLGLITVFVGAVLAVWGTVNFASNKADNRYNRYLGTMRIWSGSVIVGIGLLFVYFSL